MIVAIEGPHGCDTLGKCSPDGRFREYKYGREIVSRVVPLLQAKGYSVINTVPEENEPGLAERVRRVNSLCSKYGTGNVIFISVHVNAAKNGQWANARGWSAFTTRGNTKSDVLAEYLYKAAGKAFPGHKIRRDKSDGDSDWEKDFYVCRHTFCPAVLVENFFMDNKEDLLFLESEAGKQAIVDCLVEGISNYIESQK